MIAGVASEDLDPLLLGPLDDASPSSCSGGAHPNPLGSPIHRAADVRLVEEQAPDHDRVPAAPENARLPASFSSLATAEKLRVPLEYPADDRRLEGLDLAATGVRVVHQEPAAAAGQAEHSARCAPGVASRRLCGDWPPGVVEHALILVDLSWRQARIA